MANNCGAVCQASNSIKEKMESDITSYKHFTL